MKKRILAQAALAASIVGMPAAAAPQAAALSDDFPPSVAEANGNYKKQVMGNMSTSGYMSPQFGLVQGSFNNPCVGLPGKVDIHGHGGIGTVSAQDILSSVQNQQCTENSVVQRGDDPLAHALEQFPLLSGNGVTVEN